MGRCAPAVGDIAGDEEGAVSNKTESRNGLIPVGERLPADNKIKLVYNANEDWKGGIAEWNFAWFDCERSEKWVPTSPWRPEDITHWMSLPEYLDSRRER